jgi:tetratricopeptide (TPR) repeat protein
MISLKTAQKRHAEYFYAIIRKAGRLHNSQTSSMIGLSMIDTEWRNIVLAFDFLKSMLRRDLNLAALCNNCVSEAGFYLRLRRHPAEYLSWLQFASEAARVLEDPGIENNHLGNIGNCYFLMGSFEQAIATYHDCLYHYQNSRDLLGEARTLTGIGAVYAAKDERLIAIQYFEKSLGIAEAAGDQSLVANALLNLGGAYSDDGKPSEALPVLQRSLELFTSNNDLQGRIQVLNNLASAYMMLGEQSRAIQQLVSALQEADRLGAKREVAHLLGNLGVIFAGLQRVDEAIMLLRESLDVSLQIGENHVANITQHNLSILLNRKKQTNS